MPWVCPDCGQSFGRRNQPHSCRPSTGLNGWLARRQPLVRDVLDAVRVCVRGYGPEVHLEATRDAVMVKRARTFAEIKPRGDRVEVSFVLSRTLDEARVVRTLALTPRRVVHVVEVTGSDGVDDQLRGWLAEAYESSPL